MTQKSPKLFIETLGCAMNVRDSEHMIAELHAKEREIEQEIRNLVREQQVKEVELERLKNGMDAQMIVDFIRQKAESEDYRSYLGVVSTLSKDLEKLSQAFYPEQSQPQSAKKGKELPSIDRIILYIDDLDRCDEERVVQVLQAVHLLLAYPLFVVAIAVDSRWLLRSLREQYFKLEADRRLREEIEEDMGPFRAATPQHYLEKIIQIPFNLLPSRETTFEDLIGSLVPRSDGKQDQGGHDNTGESGDNGAERESREPNKKRQEPITSIVPLTFFEEEGEFLRQLSPFFATPRSAKRFVNIYQLVKACHGAEVSFRGDSGEYKDAALLLAIQNGAPLIANKVFEMILTSTPGERFCWRPNEPDGKETGPDSDPEGLEWQRLRNALTSLCGRNDASLPTGTEVLQKWVKRVNRYSFQPMSVTTPCERDKKV